MTKKILICTVGGSSEPIVHSIETHRPDHVCFVCSANDPATGSKGSWQQIRGKGNVTHARAGDPQPSLPNIPTRTGLAEDQYEILEVIADDLDDVYTQVTDWLMRHDPGETQILADYTGGTKTMSAGLVAAALDTEGVELQLVSGSRSGLTRVDAGQAMAMPASIEAIQFQRRFRVAVAPWHRHAYSESAMLLEDIPPPRDASMRGALTRAIALSRALDAWDRFDHEAANRQLSGFRQTLGREGFGDLLGTLKLLVEESPTREPLRLLDLWRNAQRRAVQGRHDDAIARLYRLLEWSAQWILREKAGIDTADVPPERIPESLTLQPNDKGQYQAGLFNAWRLAAALGGEQTQTFWNAQQSHIREHISKRNRSILAHGFDALTYEDWLDFSNWIEQHLLPLILDLSAAPPVRIHKLPGQLPDTYPFEPTTQPR